MTGGNNYLQNLQLDATHFNGARHYDDLPENFLETVSPHNTGPSLSLPSHHDPGSHLAGLGTMSVAGSDYASLVPMGGSAYSSNLKSESLEHHLRGGHPSSLEKFHRFSGPASLLSPLQLDNHRDPSGLLGITRNGRASEMLSSLRTNNTYVKEEMNPDLVGYNQEYDVSTMYLPSQQELERMTAATPPAISGDLLGNSCIPGAEVVQVQYDVATSQAYLPQNHEQQLQQQQSQILQQPQTTSRRSRARKNANQQQHHQQPQQQQQQQQHSSNNNNNHNNAGPSSNEDNNSIMSQLQQHQQHQQSQLQQSRQPRATGNMGPGAGVPRAVYSTSDTTDPLNAEIDDDIYIDTKDLCKRIAYELKQHSIPQAIFAERILCRSQGTLSDLLRNPKPWNRLKSGRETFRRMFNWVQQPLHVRLSILDMYKGPMGSTATPTTAVMSPPTPAQNARQNSRARLATDDSGGSAKRPRLVFTDIQKRTLQAIFKETQRPSREMQQTIAEHLRLDMSTVSNFFMNARRRSRNGNVIEDEPTPFQHIRPITPPPDSPSSTPRPPNMHGASRNRSFRSPLNGAMPEHIDEAVSAVAHGTTSSQSFHSSPQDLISPDDNGGVYSEMLNSAVDGQLLDNNIQNWDDDSVDIKPTASDFMAQYSEEDEDDNSPTNNNNPNDDSQQDEASEFVSPRSVDAAFLHQLTHNVNGDNPPKNLTHLFSSNEQKQQPASAPGSVHST